MEHPPKTVWITITLILLLAAVWLGFALLAVLGRIRGLPQSDSIRWWMAGLALACSIALALTALGLIRSSRPAFFFGLLLVLLIAVLSLTDEIGWLDLLSLIVSLLPLILLIRDRRWYLGLTSGSEKSRKR